MKKNLKVYKEKATIGIINYLNKKNIMIDNIEEIFSKIEIELGESKEYLYAFIDHDNPFKIILSADINDEDRYKWLTHEIIHVISNNQPTVNNINVGGIIIEDSKKDIWIGKYLNEAITEYINQSIINDKYCDYYDRYIEALEYIINIVGEEIILKSYFTNNLNMLVDDLCIKTNKSSQEILDFINSIDYLYDTDNYEISIDKVIKVK